jgi:rRNA processing protein Gar1
MLYDENRRPVGKVFDVFGPVRSPYVEVDVKDKGPSGLVGKMLYLLPSKRKKRSRMRK